MLHIEFTSAKFLPYLPEAYQANPGVYGFELALWLSQALMRANIPTSYPIGEDWGWLIEYIDGDAEFMLGCGSQAAAGEAYTGQPIDWYIFIKQHRSLKQRLLGSAAPALAAMLREAILTALRAEGITPKSQSQTRDANNQVNESSLAPYQADTFPRNVTPTTSTPPEISQGELYWLQVAAPGATEPGYPHPHVVLQENLLNHSRLNTVVVCGLTSNLKRATEPGNILMEVGEANLTRQSVIIVSQLSTVEKTVLGEYIGALSPQRIEQIWAGLRFQQRAFLGRNRNAGG